MIFPIILFSLLRCISSFNLSDAIINTYNGIKERNIYSYNIHLVHRPFSEFPGDIVSEGLGYGLLASLYMDDHETFQTLLENAEGRMWTGQYYNWHLDENGNVQDIGGATDAEEDIALSLIFASYKIETNQWPATHYDFYKTRAQDIVNNLWNARMISENGYICPGSNWGCDEFVNPSYFSPAWYKIFSAFDNQNHDWDTVIHKNYELLEKTVGYDNGLIPDWTTIYGGFVENNHLGYNAYGDGRYFFKDAIRILFRIGVDYLWFRDTRAEKYLKNAKQFIMNLGGAEKANFFRLFPDYNLPEEDVWIFDQGQRTRKRREHSHMTIAMWAIPVFLFGNASEKNTFLDELSKFYETNQTYWGKTNDPINNEDIYHNEMYFDQFLALFGAMIMNNSFFNIMP